MKTLILYTSSHGTTQKMAEYLLVKFSGNAELVNLKTNKNVDINQYDTIIVGTSIHAGMVPGFLRKFLQSNIDSLSHKRIALFLSCMYEGEVVEKQFNDAFPLILRNISVYNAIAGGEFLFEKMNFIEKILVKKIAKVNQSISKIDFSELDILFNKIISK